MRDCEGGVVVQKPPRMSGIRYHVRVLSIWRVWRSVVDVKRARKVIDRVVEGV